MEEPKKPKTFSILVSEETPGKFYFVGQAYMDGEPLGNELWGDVRDVINRLIPRISNAVASGYRNQFKEQAELEASIRFNLWTEQNPVEAQALKTAIQAGNQEEIKRITDTMALDKKNA